MSNRKAMRVTSIALRKSSGMASRLHFVLSVLFTCWNWVVLVDGLSTFPRPASFRGQSNSAHPLGQSFVPNLPQFCAASRSFRGIHDKCPTCLSRISNGKRLNTRLQASAAVPPTTGRFLLLLEDSHSMRNGTGRPYFEALIQQIMEQTEHKQLSIGFCTTRKDLQELASSFRGNDSNENRDEVESIDLEAVGDLFMKDIETFLKLEQKLELFLLDDWNPCLLEERFAKDRNQNNPTLYWLYGTYDAFWTRHVLRVSGFDRWIQGQCIQESCVFLGEGTGAYCAGNTMDVAKQKGNNPKASPELQMFGLDLISQSENEQDILLTKWRRDQVYVWAQLPNEEAATRFLFSPLQRGTIEAYRSDMDPLTPLIESDDHEGVECYGEPSIDPSRVAQAGRIGDSEWWE